MPLPPPTGDRADAGLHNTIPALPVRDVRAAAADYSERFGFEAPHLTDDFAVLVRDDAILHLWAASDERWRTHAGLAERPVRSGAESFLAGTASCRIQVGDAAALDGLYDELGRAGVLHPTSQEGVTTTDFGTREFATLDLDGNLLAFVQWVEG
jgi:catechol 2,3-dioxygenase-like lactoylglutathione lyase family enzyme